MLELRQGTTVTLCAFSSSAERRVIPVATGSSPVLTWLNSKKARFFLLAMLFLPGCAAKEAVVHQPLADCAISERDPSFFNSVVVVSCLPTTPGAQLFVSSGMSLSTAAMAAAQVVGGLTPKMAKAPEQMKGIFSTDDWAESLVRKLDGSTFLITVPGLSQPVIVVYRAPQL